MPPTKGNEALPRSPGLGFSLPRAYSMHAFWRSTERVSLSTFAAQCDIAGPYRGLVDNLWLLWELVLTAQPILVISNSPARCVRLIR
jgi:hypothetical protein